ncbi:MAG: SHOCT domain-containing protein [Ramlibacter sp.]|nr:SHOCT domain-containing protein [Cryobacterium sp.]
MMWGYDGGMGWTAWLFGLLAIIGITLLIVLVVRLSAGPPAGPPQAGPPPGSGTPSRSHARQILDERFAKGELTAEQYREQVRTLGEGGE